MRDVRDLDRLQLDGLREVANIGAGHAATALSTMTNRRIGVRAPELRVLPRQDVTELLGDDGQPVAAVLMRVLGDATGRTVQIFPAATAARLAEILLDRGPIPFPAGFTEMEQSVLKEVGNILVGAYLNALSDFLGMLLLMSVPTIAIDQAGAVLGSAHLGFGENEDFVLCIDTHLSMSDGDEPLSAHFLLVPDSASVDAFLRALRLD